MALGLELQYFYVYSMNVVSQPFSLIFASSLQLTVPAFILHLPLFCNNGVTIKNSEACFMKKTGVIITISVILMCAILLGYTLVDWQTEKSREPSHEVSGSETDNESALSLSSQQIKAQQFVDEAKSALATAEQVFDQLEFELAEAERYVEGLEFNGENPADYAEEGMLLLRPVIERYEDKLAVVEAAEQQLLEAQEALEMLQKETRK